MVYLWFFIFFWLLVCWCLFNLLMGVGMFLIVCCVYWVNISCVFILLNVWFVFLSMCCINEFKVGVWVLGMLIICWWLVFLLVVMLICIVVKLDWLLVCWWKCRVFKCLKVGVSLLRVMWKCCILVLIYFEGVWFNNDNFICCS